MALDETARTRVWAHAMRAGGLGPLPGVTKEDLKTAVLYIDNWIESAQGAAAPSVGFNAALPLPFRTAANAQQKTLLFCWVAMRRAGVLITQED